MSNTQISLGHREAAAALIGFLIARNSEFYGNRFAEVFAHTKKTDPLPGEKIYDRPEDDPIARKANYVRENRRKLAKKI